MTIEQMTPEEEVRLRLAAGISPSTPTEYMLRHIPLWVKMSILRRNITERATTYAFTTNTYRKNGVTVSLDNVSEFIRLSSATMWQDGQLVEVANNVPRISGEGLLIEPQRTNVAIPFTQWSFLSSGADKILGTIDTLTFFNPARQTRAIYSGGIPVSGIISVYIQASEGGEAWIQSTGEQYDRYTLSASQIRRYKTPPLQGTRAWGVLAPLGENTLRYPQAEDGEQITSYIPVGSSPTTRSPDILNIPLLPTQTITGDWDEGVTYTAVGGIATFTGHGYIRNITVEAL